MEGRSGVHDDGTFRLAAALSEAAIRDDLTRFQSGKAVLVFMEWERFRVYPCTERGGDHGRSHNFAMEARSGVHGDGTFRFSAALRGAGEHGRPQISIIIHP